MLTRASCIPSPPPRSCLTRAPPTPARPAETHTPRVSSNLGLFERQTPPAHETRSVQVLLLFVSQRKEERSRHALSIPFSLIVRARVPFFSTASSCDRQVRTTSAGTARGGGRDVRTCATRMLIPLSFIHAIGDSRPPSCTRAPAAGKEDLEPTFRSTPPNVLAQPGAIQKI